MKEIINSFSQDFFGEINVFTKAYAALFFCGLFVGAILTIAYLIK